jgi:predicted secreted protein
LFWEISSKKCPFCAAGIFVHHELHPERSEGSGGIEIWETLCVNLSQPDVSLCSTWTLSVARRCLRRKRAIFFGEISSKKMFLLRCRDLCTTATNFLWEIFAHHELHPERSEGSGGIEIWEMVCVSVSQPDVSRCSTWKLSVAQRYLRRKRANF